VAVACIPYSDGLALAGDCTKAWGLFHGGSQCIQVDGRVACGSGTCDLDAEWVDLPCDGTLAAACNDGRVHAFDCGAIGATCTEYRQCTQGTFDCADLGAGMVQKDDHTDAELCQMTPGREECGGFGLVKTGTTFSVCYEGKLFPIDCTRHTDWCETFCDDGCAG
jgi:hypothetical protein